MSAAEQPSVEALETALLSANTSLQPKAFLALASLTAALERAERERDEAWGLLGEDAGSEWVNLKARAQKAEAERDELRDLIHELRDDLARWIPALTAYDEPPTEQG